MFGIVRKKQGFIIHKKETWMHEQLMDISLVIQKSQREYIFYYPNHSLRIVETGNVKFIENGEIRESTVPRDVKIKEIRVQIPLTCVSSSKVIAHSVVVPNNNKEKQHNNEPMIHNEPILKEPQKVALKRSQRERRPTILNH